MVIEKQEERKMLRNIIVLVVCVLFLNGYAFAEKPPWAGGKGKPSIEQKEAHKKDKKEKDLKNDSEIMENESDNKEKDDEENSSKGLEKQQEKKTVQEQKELEKGSEKGQESREKRKKWWKFWEEK